MVFSGVNDKYADLLLDIGFRRLRLLLAFLLATGLPMKSFDNQERFLWLCSIYLRSLGTDHNIYIMVNTRTICST